MMHPLSEKTDVVIVDDQTANLIALEGILEAPDVNVIRATSGEQALELMLRHRPALILLDVQMPGMDGFEVARLLRGNVRTRDTPIIFVTATHHDEKFSLQGFETGAVDYLFKPLNATVVRSKVRVFVELHRGRRELERTLEELSLANRELESFAHCISHDLKAPVRSVVGFGGQLLERLSPRLEANERHDLERVVTAGERMNRMIDGLLSLCRVTRTTPQLEDVDLSALARQICDELSAQDTTRSVSFDIAAGQVVKGDRRLLELAFQNLLGNAWKFTAKGPAARIGFGVTGEGGERVYVVRDNGAGFDMAYKARLFQPFQRLHSTHEFEGTGIGLATVQRVVARHGGRVWAEGEVGAGASIYFTLRGE